MAQATANGITIEYEQHGAGEPLLLVMGLGGQLTDWPAGFVQAARERLEPEALEWLEHENAIRAIQRQMGEIARQLPGVGISLIKR